jgi:hypothetical protein
MVLHELTDSLGILHTALNKAPFKIITTYSWHFRFAMANKRDAGHKTIQSLFCDAVVATCCYIRLKWPLACHVKQAVPSLDFDLQIMTADYIVGVRTFWHIWRNTVAFAANIINLGQLDDSYKCTRLCKRDWQHAFDQTA